MADDDQDEAADAGSKKKGGMAGPVLGVLVVVALAVVLMLALQTLLPGEEDEEDAETETTVSLVDERGSLIEGHVAIQLGDVLSNVRGQDLRRYVKTTVQFWVKSEDQLLVDREEVKRRLIGSLEERLHSFNMEDLDNDSVHTRIKRGFRETIDQVLRDTFAESDPERSYVTALDIQGLLVQ